MDVLKKHYTCERKVHVAIVHHVFVVLIIKAVDLINY